MDDADILSELDFAPTSASTTRFPFSESDGVLEFDPALSAAGTVRLGLSLAAGRRSVVVITASGARVDLAPFSSPGHCDLSTMTLRPAIACAIGPGSSVLILGRLGGGSTGIGAWATAEDSPASEYVLCVDAATR